MSNSVNNNKNGINASKYCCRWSIATSQVYFCAASFRISQDKFHGMTEAFYIWVEDGENEHVYHSENFLLKK